MSQHMHKDLHLALQAAEDIGAEVPMGTKAAELYDEHIKQHNEKDFSSIMAHFNDSVLIPILKNNTQVAPLPLSDRPN